MQHILFNIATQFWGMWRYKAMAITTAWIVCLAGWAFVYALPDQYEASARVYVDTQSVLTPLLRGLTVETDVVSTASVMTRALLSRPNLEKIARETELSIRAKNARERDILLEELQARIRIINARRDNLYWIKYVDRDPQMAKRVVQRLLATFVEDTIGVVRKDTGMARQFLDEQLQEYAQRLETAENKLKEFKRKHVGMMPTDTADYYQRLQLAEEQLLETESQLNEAIQRAAQLNRQVEGEEPTFGFSAAPIKDEKLVVLDERIKRLQEELDSMLLRFTENHPDVVAGREALMKFEEERRELVNQVRADLGVVPGAGAENPVYQQLRVAAGQASAEVAVLKVRYKERKKRVENLRRLVDKVPRVEADLAKLNRDQAVVRAQYESLLKRGESARLSREADQSADNVQFQILDPPRVPLQPSSPNRLVFFIGVLIVGLGAGVGIAFLRNQIAPVIHTTQAMQFAGIPLLGTISFNYSDVQRRIGRYRFAGFVTATVSLFVVCVGLLLAQVYGIVPREKILALVGWAL